MPNKLTSFLGNTTGVKDVRFQEILYFDKLTPFVGNAHRVLHVAFKERPSTGRRGIAV